MRRREVLAAGASIAAGPIAGCTLSSSEHAGLVGLSVANDRPEPATVNVRIRNAGTGEPIRNYRVTVDAADDRETVRRLDCEWPVREPLVVTTDLIADGGAVADSREYDTRDVDAECTNVIVHVQSNGTLVYGHGTTACSDFDHRLEECERAG